MTKICDPGGSGLFVPLFSDAEADWGKGLRAVIYGIIMCYCFLGASIVSDFFMSAIEAITSARFRRCVDRKKALYRTYYVWNDTVANLTLLALGSSAPEILLSVVEVMKLEFKAGDLGPSTIVGSAAFNTLCIISVAVLAIPHGEVRFIKGVRVYHVTVFFALFAYIWLLFIVQINTKDVVEIWEAVATLGLFFLLVVIAYNVDKWEETREEMEEEALQTLEDQKKINTRMTMIQSASAGSPEFTPELSEIPGEIDTHHCPHLKKRKVLNARMEAIIPHNHQIHEKAVENMHQNAIAKKKFSQRVGPNHDPIVLGTKGLPENIVDFLKRCSGKGIPAGDNGMCILDKDNVPIANKHGVITFLTDHIEVKGCEYDTVFRVPVLRRNGTRGEISVQYKLDCFHYAVPGRDYMDLTADTLIFEDGVEYQEIEVTVLPQRIGEPSEHFQLVMSEPTGGCEFNPHDDGKTNQAIMTITIVNASGDKESPAPYKTRLWEKIVDRDLLAYGRFLWKEQIDDAFNVVDGDDPPTVPETIMFIISFPWKILLAVCSPPPVYMGGWVLFVVALAFIGLLTALVADLAEMFGCCCSLENTVTAIIVVAPGTSLPDLFASQAAAIADENADASIVNVTGSNSVNVFLGIGLPWTIAAIYWKLKNEVGANEKYLEKYPDIGDKYPDGFIVEAGSLAFSVVTFTSVSVVCLGILRIKRHLDGGELGGLSCRNKQGCACYFVFLWFWYLAWNILKSSTDDADVGQWVSIGIAVIFIGAVIAVEIFVKSGRIESKDPSLKGARALVEASKLEQKPTSKSVELRPLKEDIGSEGNTSPGFSDPKTAIVVGKSGEAETPTPSVQSAESGADAALEAALDPSTNSAAEKNFAKSKSNTSMGKEGKAAKKSSAAGPAKSGSSVGSLKKTKTKDGLKTQTSPGNG